MRALSIARVKVRITVEGVGEFDGELIRFHAPLNIQEFLRKLPLEGFAAKWDYGVYFEVGVHRGAEKTVKRVKAGDILYWPPRGYIVLAFRDTTPPAQMVKVGEFKGDLEALKSAKPGARVRILRID